MQFAAQDFARGEKSGLFSDECHRLNLFYRLQAVFHYEEIKAFDSAASLIHRDIFYPSVGLFLVRSSVFSLAVKAGGNNDSHNHNDTGSFILYKNGSPIFVDIGVESYTQKTFSPCRYEIWTMQSGYHNLPTINGLDQHDGADYHASNVVTSMDAQRACPIESVSDSVERASISMELASAYPLSESKCSYVRKVVLDKKKNEIILADSTDSQDVILNFITYEKSQITENTIKIGIADVAFQGAELIAAEILPITDKRLQTAWDHDLYRIRLKMIQGMFEMSIR